MTIRPARSRRTRTSPPGRTASRTRPRRTSSPTSRAGLSETDPTKLGRFSTGEEEFPDSPENDVERRFSDGTEQIPNSE